jgi:hypothetical protein
MKQRLLRVEPDRYSIPKVPRMQAMQQESALLLQGR